MKKWAISLLLMFFLTGCHAESEIERGMALRTALLKSPNSSFLTNITADYGEKSYSFEMECRFDSLGSMDFLVTAPESIADITGTVDHSAGALTFEENVLYFDPMADGQLSPAAAPWIFMKALRSGCISSACMDEDLLRLTMNDDYEEDAFVVDVWMDSENIPIRGELLWNGRRIITMDVREFVIS